VLRAARATQGWRREAYGTPVRRLAARRTSEWRRAVGSARDSGLEMCMRRRGISAWRWGGIRSPAARGTGARRLRAAQVWLRRAGSPAEAIWERLGWSLWHREGENRVGAFFPVIWFYSHIIHQGQKSHLIYPVNAISVKNELKCHFRKEF
jgi:hypothetical protein